MGQEANMGVSTDLFDLVHSLDQSEKRYIKLFAGLQSGEKLYMRVFDAIDTMEEYDEDALKQQFQGESAINEFHVTKNYLYNLVLRTMRIYYENKSVDAKVKNMLRDARFLESKGLTSQCLKLLRRVKKVLKLHENYLYLIEVILWEKRLAMNDPHLEKEVNRLHSELQSARQESENQLDYTVLRDKLFVEYRKNRNIRDGSRMKDLEQLMVNPLMKNQKQALGNWSRFLYYNILAFYNRVCGETSNAKSNYKKALAVWEENPHFIKENGQGYRAALFNFLNACHADGDYSNFKEYLGKAKKLSAHSKEQEAKDFQDISYLELLSLMNGQNFKKAEDLVPKIERNLSKHQAFVAESRVIAFKYNIAILKFVLEKHDQALDWVNEIVHNARSEARQDIQNFCKLLEIIIHYELGNRQLVDSLCDAVYKKFKKNGRLFKFEHVVIRHCRKLSSQINGAEEQPLFTAFHDAIIALDENATKALGYEEVLLWVRARKTKTPITELL